MMSQISTVFSPAAPINSRDLFAGRLDQVTQVLGAIAQTGQHVVLYGERGVGKTSLANTIHLFWEEARKGSDAIVTPRVNCDSTDNFGTVWMKVLEEIELYYDKQGWPFPTNGGVLEAAVKDIRNGDATPHAVRRFLDLMGKWFIVIIDEFDRLADDAGLELFADTIKTLSDHAVYTTLMLVGVADTVDGLIDDHASIDRALVQVLMPRMSNEELREIVSRGLSRVGMTVKDNALYYIARLSQGLPHHAHLLGLHAGLAALRDKRIEVQRDDVHVALRIALDRAQASVRHAYLQATASPRETLYPQILLACAITPVDDAGCFATADVRGPLSSIMGKKVEISTFSRQLHELCADSKGKVLQKLGVERKRRYRFADPLVKSHVVLRGVDDGMLDEQSVGVVFGKDGSRPTRLPGIE